MSTIKEILNNTITARFTKDVTDVEIVGIDAAVRLIEKKLNSPETVERVDKAIGDAISTRYIVTANGEVYAKGDEYGIAKAAIAKIKQVLGV